jgi:hypothetical protein
LVTFDADLEGDPVDILKLLDAMKDGVDLVCGWRRRRWADQPFLRRYPSIVASWILSRATGVELNDFGCGLKAIRADKARGRALARGDHRILPAVLGVPSEKVREVEVGFRPRPYGYSKYGVGRFLTVPFSILRVVYLRCMNRG